VRCASEYTVIDAARLRRGPIQKSLITAAIRRFVAVLCVGLLSPQPLFPKPSQTPDQRLEIVALKGDNATHLVNYHRQESPVVVARVGGVPTKGVRVKFQLPESGPGGSFLVSDQSGSHKAQTIELTTDKRGRADAKNFWPNKELGEYAIQVVATHGDQTAKSELKQKNVWSETAQKENRNYRTKVIIWSAVAAGVIVAIGILVVYSASK
jgi:hypothetical protein